MADDPFAQLKAVQREGWALFAPLEAVTTIPAARLVKHGGVRAGQRVLDVGCGTGVAALTAARQGAKVCAIDLSPALIEHGRRHAAWRRSRSTSRKAMSRPCPTRTTPST